MTKRNDDLLAAEYALGLLDDAETLAFEKRLSNEPELKAACLRWYEEFPALFDGVEPTSPPPALRGKIQDRLFAEQTKESTSRNRSPWFWPVNLLSSLILAVLIGFIYQQSQQPLFQADFVANLQTDDQSLKVLASYDKSLQRLNVTAKNASPAPGRSHELWLIAGDAPPVSLGLIKNISLTDIQLPADLASVIFGSTLAISDEPAGGSPTGGPTGAVLTTATVVEI